MAGLVQNLAGGCVPYVERARKVPWIDRSIQAVEPYILQVSEAVEIYLDAALSSESQMAPPSTEIVQCRLMRVSAADDLLKLKQPQEQGLLHRARRTGTRLLSRMEAYVDNLGPSDRGGDDSMGFHGLGRCTSESSLSSMSSDDDSCSSDTAESLCYTTAEMIPRAIMLPMVLQVHVARFVYSKASDAACFGTAMGCSLLQSGVRQCARRTLQGVCRVVAHVYVCRRAASLVDGLLENVPRVREVIVLALTDEDEIFVGGNEGDNSCRAH
jgi:hypothetical protein